MAFQSGSDNRPAGAAASAIPGAAAAGLPEGAISSSMQPGLRQGLFPSDYRTHRRFPGHGPGHRRCASWSGSGRLAEWPHSRTESYSCHKNNKHRRAPGTSSPAGRGQRAVSVMKRSWTTVNKSSRQKPFRTWFWSGAVQAGFDE